MPNEVEDPLASFRFSVEGAAFSMMGYFTEVQLPPLEMEIHEQDEGGYNMGAHFLPGPAKMGRITLKRGYMPSSAFLNWYRDAATGEIEPSPVTVAIHDSEGNVIQRWTFDRAFPTKWTGPSFKSGESSMAVESLEFAFAEVSIGE